MKKKLIAMTAALLVSGCGAAFAANPFSDVSTSDWAYQAVSDLSDQGIVEGYPDGTFHGTTNITRFELAQIVARLMAREDQYTAEQRAIISRLAGEYVAELDTLGVRVSNLEKKIGNISWSGDSRMRYKEDTYGDGRWDGRVRIAAKADVNENTVVNTRFTSGNVNLKSGSDATVIMDRINVTHNFGDFSILMGRYEFDMGTLVSWLEDSAFDGIEATANISDNALLRVGYGRFKDADPADPDGTFNEAEAFYVQAKADFQAVKLGVDYYRTSEYWEYGQRANDSVFGVNLLVPVGDFRVYGDYYKNYDGPGEPQIWTAGIGYGQVDRTVPGSFGLDLAYYDVEKGLYHQYMTGVSVDDSLLMQDGTFWLAIGDVTLMPNVLLHAEWAFGYDRDHSSDRDMKDAWTVSLVYKF